MTHKTYGLPRYLNTLENVDMHRAYAHPQDDSVWLLVTVDYLTRTVSMHSRNNEDGAWQGVDTYQALSTDDMLAVFFSVTNARADSLPAYN